MKQFIHILFAGAASLMALSACVQVPVETPDSSDAVVQFTARIPETRTAFTSPEGDSYPVLWTANDSQVKIALNMISVENAAVTPASDGKSATFAASFGTGISAPYSFSLLSPASAYDKVSGSCWEIKLRDTQTPTAQSVDEAAQILVAEAKGFSEMPQTVNFSLKHWTAYILLTVRNLDLGSAKVSAVELTAEKPLAGTWSYDTENASSTLVAGLNTIKAQTSSLDGVWFACAPADLSGTKLTVKVVTDAGNCVKELSLPDGRNLTSGTVARLTVDMAGVEPHVPGLKIERVWGKYSTATASWNEYYGGKPNTDRNVAMDDEYIYIPETTASAKLWRMSLDGQTVTEANVEGVSGGTFAMGCVRMMKNTSSKVNGGKDFLMGTSLTENDSSVPVYIYSYDEGTDKAPKRTSVQTWVSRRVGDKFTVYGSLQDGGLFFKDYNNSSAQGAFMVLKTAWGVAPVDGYFNPRRTNMVAESGVGAYYPYPGDVQHGLYTSTASARYISMDENPLSVSPNESVSSTNAGGYYVNAHGINYFTFNGKRYIAYGKNADDPDGRFYILEGEESDSWESILGGKRKVIYQASIQRDVEFFDGEYHSELEVPSPKASGNSGLDVTVRQIGDAVYIAAVKQNVGLSLFKMTLE